MVNKVTTATVIGLNAHKVEVEIDTCNAIVKALRETMTQPEEISMSRENKENIYGWLVQVKDPMRIEGFGELMELIARIKSS